MGLTYTVRGVDGKEYGPATLEEINTWVTEGRLDGQQQVRRSDSERWAPAREFSELQPLFTSTTTATAVAAPGTTIAEKVPADAALFAQMKSGASWFYWIAGLSLVNSLAAFSGTDWRFFLGLGITQAFDELRPHFGAAGQVVVLMLDLIATGLFILFGVFANKRHTWAFIVGMVLFGLDGIIFLLAQDWIGVGFHVFALYCLFRGLSACRKLGSA